MQRECCCSLPACAACARTGLTPATTLARRSRRAKYFERLSRQLKDKNPEPAYQQLSAYAMQKSSGVFGVRAALALGYFDYTKAHYEKAAKWFERAKV